MMPTMTIIKSSQRLTKQWAIKDGAPVKEAAGQMTRGHAEPVAVADPGALVAVLRELKSTEALCFGVPMDGQSHPITTAAMLPQAEPGTIARTNDHFRWPAGPGWMVIDCDPPPGGTPLDRDGLFIALHTACRALIHAPIVWSVSGSSHIHNAQTGEAVTGLRGQRVYVLVADARDIPRAGRALFDRLWLTGHGYYAVSRAGSVLERAPIDAAVWQPSRLDFAAPPVTVAPLEARRPAPLTRSEDAAPLDTANAIPDLTPDERQRLAEIKAAARGEADLLDEQRITRENWVGERVAQLPADLTDEQREAAADRLRAAVTDYRLWGDFELIHRSGQRVTVGQLLDAPDKWHGERFADPLEPGSDKRIAWANLRSGGRPYLYSHMHGGQRFTLLRPAQRLELSRGEAPRAVAAVLERLRTDAEVFERAGQLVRLADGALVPIEQPWLRTHLEQCFQFASFDARAKDWRVADCPQDLAARVMAARGEWSLPNVAGIVSHPVMRSDGSIIERPGFDASTGLLYLDEAPERPKVRPLGTEALRDALLRIWEPFARFPFDTDLSRAVFLAALFTTVCRPALPTAPAFLIRAYAPGTGKTLLSECLMLLCGAPLAALPLPEGNAEEIEKRLFAKLLTGGAGLVLDNLTGIIDSAALCAMLTSAEPEGRILGKSEVIRLQNRALIVLNGNNVSPGGDLFRRVLPVSLDANSESPETRRFSFDPREVIRQRLHSYRADLLAVMRTYQAAGAPVVGDGGFGSFSEWERLVRQCICWLAAEGVAPAPLADPLEVLALSKAEDPHHAQHINVLEAWHGRYGSRPIQVKDLADLMRTPDSYASPEERALIEALKEVGIPMRGRGEFEARYFAGWLRRHRGRVVAGLRLDQHEAGSKKDSARWTVRAA